MRTQAVGWCQLVPACVDEQVPGVVGRRSGSTRTDALAAFLLPRRLTPRLQVAFGKDRGVHCRPRDPARRRFPSTLVRPRPPPLMSTTDVTLPPSVAQPPLHPAADTKDMQSEGLLLSLTSRRSGVTLGEEMTLKDRVQRAALVHVEASLTAPGLGCNVVDPARLAALAPCPKDDAVRDVGHGSPPCTGDIRVLSQGVQADMSTAPRSLAVAVDLLPPCPTPTHALRVGNPLLFYLLVLVPGTAYPSAIVR